MKNGLAIFAMGLTCGVISSWAVGCTNHGPYAHLPASTAAPSGQTQNPANPSGASIAGTWDCLEESCDDLIVTIAPDLSSMTTYETLHDAPGGQSCRIQEPSKLDITDSSDPDRLEGTLSRGSPSLVIAVNNTDGCDNLVKELGDASSDVERITLERDGNQILIVNGQRFVRAQENRS